MNASRVKERLVELFEDRATPETASENVKQASVAVPEGPFRILVVDDSASNQGLMKAMLKKKFGYSVDVAGNGIEAIDMVKHLPFDLVLMDCQMPEMDGFDATREIRHLESQGLVSVSSLRTSGRLPVIALTASAMKGDRERCLACGMDAYLSKPIKVKKLIGVMRQFLSAEVVTA